ncbi:hypothetical protein [Mucilaginibacter aquariorum]|uniref:CHAD domain-containing protein n=1 Tax=Mucilaginibacter aquariorum TaxID=2967225 RepID=A0ABT1TAB1_9SPHI|nr:hypothetical protein [Mucilaginibacter aquariorum]MCQ6961571.1 hypothetical protein [Mucilaginibacter aquariorum]
MMIIAAHNGKDRKLPARLIYYYVNAQRRRSDLAFFQVELNFLQELLSDHFMQLTVDSEGRKRSKRLKTALFQLEKKIAGCSVRLDAHLHLITSQAEKPEEPGEALAAGQVALDQLVTELTGRYRKTKKELFALITEVIRENKFLAG